MISHVILILFYTVLSILHFNVNATNGGKDRRFTLYYKISNAWTIVGGIADLFITCMLWFILDDRSRPDIFKHGERNYPVLDVIKRQS